MYPILFNLVIEVLANKLRKKDTITGIKVAQIEYKLSLYANDVVFLMTLRDSIVRLQDLLNQYGRVPGYTVG